MFLFNVEYCLPNKWYCSAGFLSLTGNDALGLLPWGRQIVWTRPNFTFSFHKSRSSSFVIFDFCERNKRKKKIVWNLILQHPKVCTLNLRSNEIKCQTWNMKFNYLPEKNIILSLLLLQNNMLSAQNNWI